MDDLCDLIQIIQALFSHNGILLGLEIIYVLYNSCSCSRSVKHEGNCYCQLEICFIIEEPQKNKSLFIFLCEPGVPKPNFEFFRDRFNVEKQLLGETATILPQSVIQSPSSLQSVQMKVICWTARFMFSLLPNKLLMQTRWRVWLLLNVYSSFSQMAGFINSVHPFCGDKENLTAFRFYALNPIVDPWVFIICRKSVLQHFRSLLSCRFGRRAVKNTAHCALSLPLDSHAQSSPPNRTVQTSLYPNLPPWPCRCAPFSQSRRLSTDLGAFGTTFIQNLMPINSRHRKQTSVAMETDSFHVIYKNALIVWWEQF